MSDDFDEAMINSAELAGHRQNSNNPRPTHEGRGILTPANDPVNHPQHYTDHPSGVECIQITEHMNFCLGNAVKYLWRAGLKGDAVEDLKKARWYIDRELQRLDGAA